MMKKILSFILCLSLLVNTFSFFPLTASAESALDKTCLLDDIDEIVDVLFIQAYLAFLNTPSCPELQDEESAYFLAADIDGDGIITIIDVTIRQLRLIGYGKYDSNIWHDDPPSANNNSSDSTVVIYDINHDFVKTIHVKIGDVFTVITYSDLGDFNAIDYRATYSSPMLEITDKAEYIPKYDNHGNVSGYDFYYNGASDPVGYETFMNKHFPYNINTGMCNTEGNSVAGYKELRYNASHPIKKYRFSVNKKKAFSKITFKVVEEGHGVICSRIRTLATVGSKMVEEGVYSHPFDTDTKVIRNPVVGSIYCNSGEIPGIDVNFDSNWFFTDSAGYNHDIAKLCSEVLLSGYIAEDNEMNGVETDLLETLGSIDFDKDNIEYNLNTGRDEMNYFIASKPIYSDYENPDNNNRYNLVFVGCIGSWKTQWNSNFDPYGLESSTSYADTANLYRKNHIGFNDAKNFMYQKMSDYLNGYKDQFDKDHTIILLTGHSRGAATANLLGAKLIDESNNTAFVNPQNLFTYTFATPNNTRDENRSNAKYSRIFNIVNPTDFVTKALPTYWGYGRYGTSNTTYSLPTKTNDSNYSSLKSKMLRYYLVLNSATNYGDLNYFDYEKGEVTVYNVVDDLTSSVESVDEFYEKRMIWSISTKRISTFEFFKFGLCPLVNGSLYPEAATDFMKSSAYSPNKVFRSLSLFFITNQGLLLTRFADAHKMETYCAYMLGLSADEITLERRAYYCGSVNCPVDIEITDTETGEVVGRIVDNTVDETIAAKDNSIVMTVDGDEKGYWLPSDGSYEVHLTGSDSGVMDYTLCEIDSDLGETARKNYLDLPVEKDKAYTSVFTGEDQSFSAIVLKDDNNRSVTPDETYSSGQSPEYTVTTVVEGSGIATDTLTVTSGDYVTVTAAPIRSEFIGWYQGDTLISEEEEYRFRPTESVTLTAKFTEAPPVIFGDADMNGEVESIDATYIQRHTAEIEIPFTLYETTADVDGDGEIALPDATAIQYYLAHMQTLYPIGEPV